MTAEAFLTFFQAFANNSGARLLAGLLFFGLLGWLFYRLGRGVGKRSMLCYQWLWRCYLSSARPAI